MGITVRLNEWSFITWTTEASIGADVVIIITAGQRSSGPIKSASSSKVQIPSSPVHIYKQGVYKHIA